VADRILVIESGEIIFENTREEVDAEKISSYLSV
jgi:ABC-type Na+ transport system ATPase subunit NatA